MESLGLSAPEINFIAVLKSLWYVAKGDWNQDYAPFDH